MIALDAMGGDYAPDEIIKGALRCVKAHRMKVALFGPQEELERRLDQLDVQWRDYPLILHDAPDIIGMGDEPVDAVKKKINSSLVKTITSVANNTSSVAISAGNSGAVMAAALFSIGRTEGIDRPALVGLLPAFQHPVVCLDLGAITDCRAENLYQWAHLGFDYAKKILGIDRPTVGLLSNGEESTKGSLITKEAFRLLQQSPLPFIGNIEPLHIIQNRADVVVTNGFTGNILLKTYEATVSFCCSFLPQDMRELILKRTALDRQSGAVLLGIKKPVLVVHGNAHADVIERALLLAQKISLQ
jgi:phosphate acyltransferase